jgi:hypothetical protein
MKSNFLQRMNLKEMTSVLKRVFYLLYVFNGFFALFYFCYLKKIDALLHRVQAVKEKTLYIYDKQSTFSNLDSHEIKHNSRYQIPNDQKELPVPAYQEEIRLDNLLDNELNKLRRFHPLQFPVRYGSFW